MLGIGQTVYTVCVRQVGSYKKSEFIPKYGREYPVTHYKYKVYVASQKILKFLGTEEGIVYITDGCSYMSFQEYPDGTLNTVPTPSVIPEFFEKDEEKPIFNSKPVYLTLEDAVSHLQSHKEYVESTYSHAEVVGMIDHIIRSR
ncbi:MAG: hypothetical protein NC489_26110 [Ruminococcus flavefaciens]|nr:hypothetical protein [Ruminococcus flavefaciens]